MEDNPTLQDTWRLLGAVNERIADLDACFGALNASIEARAHRLTELENPRG
jgi:hypothetical protein